MGLLCRSAPDWQITATIGTNSVMKFGIVRLGWENTMPCAHLLNVKCVLALRNVAVQIGFLRQIVR